MTPLFFSSYFSAVDLFRLMTHVNFHCLTFKSDFHLSLGLHCVCVGMSIINGQVQTKTWTNFGK